MIRRNWLLASAALAVVLGGASLYAAHTARASVVLPSPERSTPPGAIYVSRIPPAQRRVFFGELHLHTAASLDAWTYGSKLDAEQAFRFGRGETVMVPAVQIAKEEGFDPRADVPARRAWPLDFMAVTDHSENIGVLNQLDDPSSALARSEIGKQILANPIFVLTYMSQLRVKHEQPDPAFNVQAAGSRIWAEDQRAANANYRPGKFTTFIAYEWSANPQRKNLHRNVIFNSDHAPAPFSANDSQKPEDLWSYLEKTRASGIDVIAIPHNGNASGGLMYDWNDSNGRPIDEAYAQRRAMNEPLTEISQVKGQSDTLPVISPTDEFANFEIYDHLLDGAPGAAHGGYVREAFGRGLVIQSKVGANPFKYGVVGGSDIHNGLSASDEKAYAGGQFGLDPNTMLPRGEHAHNLLSGARTTKEEMEPNASEAGWPSDPAVRRKLYLERGSAGLTGVWAEENTRNSIFAALKRKETFATSGTRLRVRVFGGWGFDRKLLADPDWVARAYATGVPMGGDLPAKPADARAPGFIIQAMKDPTGANLDRVQVIKLSLDGESYKEKIFDVALSGGRKVDPKSGHAPPVGDTVNLRTGLVSDTIGAPAFTIFWRDPEFDPDQPAVYYIRVLQIPTPRWSTLLAIRNHLPIPQGWPATIQERAWSSPVWFTPAGFRRGAQRPPLTPS